MIWSIWSIHIDTYRYDMAWNHWNLFMEQERAYRKDMISTNAEVRVQLCVSTASLETSRYALAMCEQSWLMWFFYNLIYIYILFIFFILFLICSALIHAMYIQVYCSVSMAPSCSRKPQNNYDWTGFQSLQQNQTNPLCFLPTNEDPCWRDVSLCCLRFLCIRLLVMRL